MVQLKLPEVEKEADSPSLLPFTKQELEVAKPGRSSSSMLGNKSCALLMLLAVLFSFITIKEICDLKQENLELLKMLALEKQKDAALKLAVRDHIPSERFLSHSFSSEDVALVEAEGTRAHIQTKPAGWSIKLSVLWSSPTITPCDMARLSHMLADEIYSRQVASELESDFPLPLEEDMAYQDIQGSPELEDVVDAGVLAYDDVQEKLKHTELFASDNQDTIFEEYDSWYAEDDSEESSEEEDYNYNWSAEDESEENLLWDSSTEESKHYGSEYDLWTR